MNSFFNNEINVENIVMFQEGANNMATVTATIDGKEHLSADVRRTRVGDDTKLDVVFSKSTIDSMCIRSHQESLSLGLIREKQITGVKIEEYYLDPETDYLYISIIPNNLEGERS